MCMNIYITTSTHIYLFTFIVCLFYFAMYALQFYVFSPYFLVFCIISWFVLGKTNGKGLSLRYKNKLFN